MGLQKSPLFNNSVSVRDLPSVRAIPSETAASTLDSSSAVYHKEATVRINTLLGLASAAVMAVVLAAPVSAQTPSPATQAQPSAQAPATAPASQAAQPVRSPVEGELVSVDSTAMKITIKPANGPDLVFTYNDKTAISGAQKDAAGLATVKDGRVTVHFTEDPDTKARTATRVIVEPKK
jgi:biotin carboxyl carrier protein